MRSGLSLASQRVHSRIIWVARYWRGQYSREVVATGAHTASFMLRDAILRDVLADAAWPWWLPFRPIRRADRAAVEADADRLMGVWP
jgi:hypothetical protein